MPRSNDSKIDRLTKVPGNTSEPITYEVASDGFMRAGEEPDPNEPIKRAKNAAWNRWIERLKKI